MATRKYKKINILEIGVDNGDSLRLWREYFPNANICGIDIKAKQFEINKTVSKLTSSATNSQILDKHILPACNEGNGYVFRDAQRKGRWCIKLVAFLLCM